MSNLHDASTALWRNSDAVSEIPGVRRIGPSRVLCRSQGSRCVPGLGADTAANGLPVGKAVEISHFWRVEFDGLGD